MKQFIQSLTITDVIMFCVICAAGLALVWFYEKPKEKPTLKASKPRRGEITRSDILDAKLSGDHEQYLLDARNRALYLDEHEQAIAE